MIVIMESVFGITRVENRSETEMVGEKHNKITFKRNVILAVSETYGPLKKTFYYV